MTNLHQAIGPRLLAALLLASFFTGCATPSRPALTAAQHRDLAYAAALRGDAAEAKEHGRKSITLDPKSHWNRVAYGWCLLNLDLNDEALAQWKKAFKMDPANHRINACLALANYRLRKKEEAFRCYTRQVVKDSDFGSWKSLQETTSHWQPKEKAILHALFKEWRSSRARNNS